MSNICLKATKEEHVLITIIEYLWIEGPYEVVKSDCTMHCIYMETVDTTDCTTITSSSAVLGSLQVLKYCHLTRQELLCMQCSYKSNT